MKLVGEGAESKVFETKIFGKAVLVKVRTEKGYREKTLDIELRASRTRQEARTMNRAKNAGVNVPAILALGLYSIYMEKISGKLLKDTRVDEKQHGDLGRILASLHGAGIIHGDFTPANIIISEGRLYVIDFGLSEISNSVEGQAIDLLLMKRSLSPVKYGRVEQAYGKAFAKSKEVLARLTEIEKRGRYQVRTLQ